MTAVFPRKNPHPVFVLALGAGLLIYLPWKAIIFFLLTLVWLGTGLRALLCPALRRTHAVYWLALGFGIWAGLLDYSLEALSVPQCAFPSEKVRGVELAISGDPGPTKSGNTMLAVSLKAVIGRDGARVSARGKLTLVVAGSWFATRGSVILAPATADALEKGLVFARSDELKVIRQGPPLEALRTQARCAILAALDLSTGNASPLVKALIVGYRGELDAESVRAFTDAGCAHILALSGQHVAVLVCIAGVLARLLFGKRREFACCAAGLAVFAWITGASPSVIRAVLQYCLAGLFAKIDRPQSGLAVLCYTFAVSCFLFPGSARTLSFELSYLAVAGIMVFAEPAGFFLKKYFPRAAASSLGLGLGAMAGTSLLCVLVFGSVNLLAPLTSALVGPLITLLIWTGICGTVLVSVAPILAFVSRTVAECTEQAALFVVKAGCSGFRAGGPGFIAGFSVVAITGFVLYCYLLRRNRQVPCGIVRKAHEKTDKRRTRKPLHRTLENLRAAR